MAIHRAVFGAQERLLSQERREVDRTAVKSIYLRARARASIVLETEEHTLESPIRLIGCTLRYLGQAPVSSPTVSPEAAQDRTDERIPHHTAAKLHPNHKQQPFDQTDATAYRRTRQV